MKSQPSKLVGARYEPLFELGRGGMGTATLARVTGVGGFERLVVLKRIHSYLLDDDEVRRRFLNEARLAACVHHANVVGVQQVLTDSEGPFLVLDYVEGASLAELVDWAALKHGALAPPLALRVVLDALDGLHAIHEARDGRNRALDILHRDISTHNVLVGIDGVSRIADFGIAKSTLSTLMTDKATMLGRLRTMAPEYLERRPVDRRLDVYAVGVSLWEALAAHPPWPDRDDPGLVGEILGEGMPPLPEHVGVGPEVRSLVARACARQPEARFATAREMARAIEDLDRKNRGVASRAEVAAFIAELFGVELGRRREKVARAAAEAVRSVPAPPLGKQKAQSPPPARNWLIGAVAVGVLVALTVLWFSILAANQ